MALAGAAQVTAAQFDARGGQFIGFKRFGAFEKSPGAKSGEIVLTSPVIQARINWNQLVASWNADAPPGTFLEMEVRACYAGHTTKFYSLGRWSSDPARYPRQSVAGQEDADGSVSTDTLILKSPAARLQLRITLGGDNGSKPSLKFVGLSLLDTNENLKALSPNRAAWNRVLPVIERSQMGYPNGNVLCSPTTVSMLMSFWAQILHRPELNQDVPEVASAVYDPQFEGTGNWPFNMAYAGSFPHMRAYVARLSDISEIEDWVAEGVPVGLSVCYDRLRGIGPGPNGHLVACVGFTAGGDPIINDPGTSKQVRKVFPRERLAYAWAYSRNTAYLVYPENWEVPTDRFGHWDSWTAHRRVRFLPGPVPPAQAVLAQANTPGDPTGGDPEVQRFLVSPEKEPRLSNKQMTGLVRKHIKYVFVLYQENRSFDSYFGTFPGADGLFSQPPEKTPGFYQTIININGSTSTIHPFRIGPAEYAADTDDINHSHPAIVAKMDVVNGAARMDRFALVEEKKHWTSGATPSLKAKQMGELAMAYVDGDTVPFLWRYASRFVLFDHIFQLMTGPSTPGNLSIIAAQAGQTQAALHPNELYLDHGSAAPGVPVLNDNDPFWGSRADTNVLKMPVNPVDLPDGIQINQTYATLPLSLAGEDAEEMVSTDRDPKGDLEDVADDVRFLTQHGQKSIAWGWYQEGFDHEPTDPNLGPTDAEGTHASYITHHNGPQYFGYIANNPQLSRNLRGLKDFFVAVRNQKLPPEGGVFFVKGGYTNLFGLKPANPAAAVQRNFLGDDDHPAYSDAQISEAMVAKAVNAIARSPYWDQCAIIITWDDSEGDYDHVPPPIRSHGPHGSVISDGPRVPLLLLSPYARTHFIAHDMGDHGSVVKFADVVFGLKPLATLPDEEEGRELGKKALGQSDWGPDDALTPGVSDLLSAFDPSRLNGAVPPLPASYAIIPDELVNTLPQNGTNSVYGLAQIGVIPVDRANHIPNVVPPDFNPRPLTTPTQ